MVFILVLTLQLCSYRKLATVHFVTFRVFAQFCFFHFDIVFRCDAPAHGTIYHDLYDLLKDAPPRSTSTKLLGDLFSADTLSDDDDDDSDMDLSNDDAENKENAILDLKHKMEGMTTSKYEVEEMKREYDKWPDGHSQDIDHEKLFVELQRLHIRFYIGTQTKWTDKMVSVFRAFTTSIGYDLTEMDLDSVSQFLPTLIEAVSDAVRIIRPPKRPQIELNLESLQKRKVSFKVQCGIDFGTAGSGMLQSVFCRKIWKKAKRECHVREGVM